MCNWLHNRSTGWKSINYKQVVFGIQNFKNYRFTEKVTYTT